MKCAKLINQVYRYLLLMYFNYSGHMYISMGVIIYILQKNYLLLTKYIPHIKMYSITRHVFKGKKLTTSRAGRTADTRYCTTLSRPNLIKRVSGGDGIFKLCWKRISDLGHGTETSTLACFLILFFGLSSTLMLLLALETTIGPKSFN